LKEIGGAGHFLMLEKPAEVASEIRAFWKMLVYERSGCPIRTSPVILYSARFFAAEPISMID
jgi:hypothetical protein